VRNTPKYTRDAQIEVKYMERVCQKDPMGEFSFVRISRNFINEQGHMCIVMPKHGKCLLDVIQKNGPMSASQVAQVAFQLGRTLDFLHTQNRYIHTDLKPENILLDSNPAAGGSPNPIRLRICDLGGCSDERHSRNSVVSTRHYRAPEVVLGLGWMYPADMWSVGCILYELAVGRLLYDTHDNLEHMNMMVATLGALPSDWGAKCMDEAKPLFGAIPPYTLKPCAKSSRLARLAPIESLVRDEWLASLIRSCLCYDQTQRITARQMMSHPFVTRYCPESMQAQLMPVAASHPQ
jgi:serine/threonine protein kinase